MARRFMQRKYYQLPSIEFAGNGNFEPLADLDFTEMNGSFVPSTAIYRIQRHRQVSGQSDRHISSLMSRMRRPSIR